MTTDTLFAPRSLTGSEYVSELFGPSENVAILVRNRNTGITVQRIAKAEIIPFTFDRRRSVASSRNA